MTRTVSFVLILTGLVMATFTQCTEPGAATPPLPPEKLAQALQLLENNCMSCHAPHTASGEIAPSLLAIQQAYLHSTESQIDATESMVAFIENPQLIRSYMKAEVTKYGIMPRQDLERNAIEATAEYLLQTDMSSKDWKQVVFAEDKASVQHLLERPTTEYTARGKELALATKAVLGKNLLNAIQTQGTANALAFCNERAITLTDSMAAELHASIRRVSDQNRNPGNTANDRQLAYITQAKAQLSANGKAAPQLYDDGDHMTGYYPITTNAMCLQCHGKPESDIAPETLSAIEQYYPRDLATGYGENELRGIWVVEMEKEE